jgi:hypothetical protein
MPGPIDPSTLTGTLKTLAEQAARLSGNLNLVEEGVEKSIFQQCAQSLIDSGKAKDFTQEDLNRALGLEIHQDQDVAPVYGAPDFLQEDHDTIQNNVAPVYGIPDIPDDNPEPVYGVLGPDGE